MEIDFTARCGLLNVDIPDKKYEFGIIVNGKTGFRC